MDIDNNTVSTLIEVAAKAKQNARVERTGFHVGAALLTQSGEVITGCNMELNTILVSICAERCTIAKAVSQGHQAFKAMAIVSDATKAIAPCGICRQFLVDFGLDWIIIMANADATDVKTMTVGQLVPMAFTGKTNISQ
jgi:cytidine deaminase